MIKTLQLQDRLRLHLPCSPTFLFRLNRHFFFHFFFNLFYFGSNPGANLVSSTVCRRTSGCQARPKYTLQESKNIPLAWICESVYLVFSLFPLLVTPIYLFYSFLIRQMINFLTYAYFVFRQGRLLSVNFDTIGMPRTKKHS